MNIPASKSGIAIIYYCPNGESAAQAPAIVKYRYDQQTIFLELLREATTYFGEDFGNVVLKDNFGATWPVNRSVWTELASVDRDLRLCQIHEASEDTVEEEEPASETEELVDEDVTRTVGKRPPLLREFVVHMLFLGVLLA